MAYDLENTFPNTWTRSHLANGSSAAILAKYPFVCSRQALYKSIDESGIQTVAQRNPNGYTVREITDKICAHWDEVMADNWSSDFGDYSPTAWASVITNYRWDQKQFWSKSEMSYIAYGTGSTTSTQTAAQVIADTDIIFLPATQHNVNTTEYLQKPFLAFDYEAVFNSSTGPDYKIGTDNFGVELDVNGSNQVTGVTSGGITDDSSGWSSKNLTHLLNIYDNSYYHDDLNVNGYLFDVNPSYAGHDVISTSTKWYDLRVAKFAVTIAGGEVTAVTPTARNDGDGTPVTGGWGYSTDDDYRELNFIRDIAKDAFDVDPRVLYRSDTAQAGYTGNKSTVSLVAESSEFYPGANLAQVDISTAYAFYGQGSPGYAVSPTVGTSDEWYQINLPTAILPKSVRVSHERPALTTTSRSLKTKTVGTGAHRLSWEFEYPPLSRQDAQYFIDFFEKAKGVSDVQIFIPWTVMYHSEYWGAGKTSFSPTVSVVDGALGSASVTLDGHEPGNNDLIPSGTYIELDQKTYRILTNSGTPDDYGRVTYRVEPPLIKNATGLQVRTNPANEPTRKEYFLIKAQLADDVLDYTVDAAGLYRIRFKFREVL